MVVMDNSYLGMVRQWQQLFYDNRRSWTPMCNPDFCKIAEGYGIPSRFVKERSELDAAIKEMLETPGAFLLSIVVRAEDNVMPMMPLGASVCEMILE